MIDERHQSTSSGQQIPSWTKKKSHQDKSCCCSVTKSCLTLCNPWTAACQAPLSSTISQSLLKFMFIELLMLSNHLILCRLHTRAGTRDPTHDKVMRKRPDGQGGSGFQGFRKVAPALTLKMISVFLMLASIDYSLISVTQAEGLPHLFPNKNQFRTLIKVLN
ncbi:unnamed protein product [Rangifer tarandus platyrhynchus]|uniref:Uncharacterized protein n=1 Tax=Rangifer tarandus platyrhynchus TaxID=3082113 RepID=A0ABN8Z5R2_RANTA|nr:unnamed protein product [Rangifer tarandus platyrhynchus]